MGNNKRDHNDYSTGYNPRAVEHDLQIISQLTHGMIYNKKNLTMQQAQEIYYKIKKENIQFQSDTGEEFLLRLYENMTDAQIQEVNQIIRRRNQKKQNRRQLLRINRGIACAVSLLVLVSSISDQKAAGEDRKGSGCAKRPGIERRNGACGFFCGGCLAGRSGCG